MAADGRQVRAGVQVLVERLAFEAGLDNREAQANVAQCPPADIGRRLRIKNARRTTNALCGVDEATLLGTDDQLLAASINALHTQAGVLLQLPGNG